MFKVERRKVKGEDGIWKLVLKVYGDKFHISRGYIDPISRGYIDPRCKEIETSRVGRSVKRIEKGGWKLDPSDLVYEFSGTLFRFWFQRNCELPEEVRQRELTSARHHLKFHYLFRTGVEWRPWTHPHFSPEVRRVMCTMTILARAKTTEVETTATGDGFS